MIHGYIRGATRTIGLSQGFAGLNVRDEELEHVDRHGKSMGVSHHMRTLWHPTVEELNTLNAGGGLILSLLGSAHPPVHLEIVPREEFDPIPDRTTPAEAVKAEGQTTVTVEE